MTTYHNEIDKQCCEVLRRHFPQSVVDERSIEDVEPEELEGYGQCHFFAGIGGFSLAAERYCAGVDVWTGGFPCQDLSVAGKREGLAGERSGLYFAFHRLIAKRLPGWVVLENVPGLLSSNEGKDFAIVVGGLTGVVPEVPEDGWGNAGLFRGAVYQVAYRVLDAQFFGVPQRRRRVFIVASLGSGRCAEVLFERENGTGNVGQRQKTGEGISHALTASASASGRLDPRGETYITAWTVRSGKDGGGKGYLGSIELGMPLCSQPQFVGVRRFTPLERERLQGFPDGWTKGQSDTVRQYQLGNAVAVPVVEWIMRRLKMASER